MKTSKERVEAAIERSGGTPEELFLEMTVEARALAEELSQAQGKIAEHEATNRLLTATVEHVRARVVELEENQGTSTSPISLKIRRLQKQYEETQIQLTEALGNLAKSESGAAVMRKYLEEIAKPALGGKLQQYAAQEALKLSTDSGKSMVPRAVLLECRDALKNIQSIYLTIAESFGYDSKEDMQEDEEWVFQVDAALKSATQALGDSP